MRSDDTESLTGWIARLYEHPDLVRMGHNQRAADLNLGLGWLYYGFARLLRPARAVVIGSWRGFVPMVVAKGCQDNLERGQVTFIDPSLVDDFWKDPAKVEEWFARFGLANIRHHCLTTQEFVETDDYRRLGEIGLLVVDGFHTAEQARIDYEAFQGLLAPRALVLFHDSMRGGTSGMYDRDKPYQVSVRDYMEELRADPGLELLDIAYGEGLTVLRKLGPGSDEPLRDPADRPRRSAARPAS